MFEHKEIEHIGMSFKETVDEYNSLLRGWTAWFGLSSTGYIAAVFTIGVKENNMLFYDCFYYNIMAVVVLL